MVGTGRYSGRNHEVRLQIKAADTGMVVLELVRSSGDLGIVLQTDSPVFADST